MREDRSNKSADSSKKSGNSRMALFTYIFIVIFLVLSGYILYFVVHDSDKVLNNPANKRSEVWAKRVVRGDILSADGKKLATTKVSKKGSEKRTYPYGSLYTPVIGRTTHGTTGLESSENYDLLTTNLNPIERIYNEINGNKSPGNNIVTTLDSSISEVAGEALGNNRGAVVVMEPKTGKILAMVSKPSYDANDFDDDRWDRLQSDSDDESPLLNRATQGQYPPGSTFKMYTSLAFIRQDKAHDIFSYNCTGSIGTGDGKIRCYGGEVHGKVDFEKAFAESCNTAFCTIGSKLDIARWREMCEDFYYNTSTPIDKLEKTSSKFLLDSSTSKGDVMQASIGQGDVLVTPLQNIFMVAAVANNGKLMKPYIVDHVESFDGKVLSENKPKKLKRVMTKDESKQMNKLMRATVKYGTATNLYYGTPYKAAGKTGSAEFQAGSSESHAWFVGYAKMGKRTVAVSIIVERGGTGGAVAVPIAKKIFDEYFS